MSYVEIEIKLFGTDGSNLSVQTGAEVGTKLRDLLNDNRESILGHLKSKLANQGHQGGITDRTHFRRVHDHVDVDTSTMYVANPQGVKLLPSYVITRAQTIAIYADDSAAGWHDPIFSKGIFGTTKS